MINGLEHLLYKEGLRSLWQFCIEKKQGEVDMINVFNIMYTVVKEDSRHHPILEIEAIQ